MNVTLLTDSLGLTLETTIYKVTTYHRQLLTQVLPQSRTDTDVSRKANKIFLLDPPDNTTVISFPIQCI